MLAAHTPKRELEVVVVAVLGLPPLVRLARVGPAVQLLVPLLAQRHLLAVTLAESRLGGAGRCAQRMV